MTQSLNNTVTYTFPHAISSTVRKVKRTPKFGFPLTEVSKETDSSSSECSDSDNSEAENDQYPYCNWMEQIRDSIAHRPIRNILIPGSHDAISFAFTPTSPFSAELEKVLPLQPFKLYHPITCSFAKTQKRNLYIQLKIGSRYLDMRFQHDTQKNLFFGHHGLLGMEANELFYQIREFAEEFPSEIIFLRFSHFLNFTPESHIQFQLLIEKYFGSMFLSNFEMTQFFSSLLFFPKLDLFSADFFKFYRKIIS